MRLSGARVTLINPNLVLQRDDVFTTGVVYMPVGLACFAGQLRAQGASLNVIDAFGDQPNQYRQDGPFWIRGLDPSEVVARVQPDTEAVVFYAINLTYHRALARLIQAVRARFPAMPLLVIENTQAVTAYALKNLQSEFFDLGINYVVQGEPEERGVALLEALRTGSGEGRDLKIGAIDGIGFRDARGEIHSSAPERKIADLDQLPFPAWELFPLKNYWALGYAHGPLSSKKYLPLLTSRGCPYNCRFCVIPATNDLKWRARSAANVADEIAHFQRLLGVDEFHIEDVDPTVRDTRTQEFCQELIRRKLRVKWKICAGTKIETIKSEKTVELMAASGCNYVSISPESGSPRVMKLIGMLNDDNSNEG
jgi:hypothetical protein